MSDCLKELEIKNKMINILQAENKVYRNEQSGWVKELERRQAKIRELEKLDLNVRGLMLENKVLQAENKAYKGIVEEVRDIILYHIGPLEPNEVLDIIDNTSNKYLEVGNE